MKNLYKTAVNIITKRLSLWLVSLLGFSGIATIFSIMIIVLLIVGIVGGASSANTVPTIPGGAGGSFCSPTSKISKENWSTVFAGGGKLKEAQDDIISISNKQGIDPVLFAAIALHETGFGTSPGIINKNNPGGLMTSNGLMVFSTLNEGLEAMGRTLHNRIIVDGLNTIDKLGNVYAPLGAANDPNKLNVHWIPNITSLVEKLGGLTMNCDASNVDMPDLNFDGNTTDLRKNIVKSATKWIGAGYYWGGGRNPAEVALGHFDCSSFVRWAFSENGIDLSPMGSVSTDTLKYRGKAINIKDVKVGDIIFFDTYKVDGHVVIYIGNGKFIGCNGTPEDGGVSIENMSSPYWTSVFKGHVRRVIND